MTRVATGTVFQQALADIRRNQAEIARLQAGVGNGKRIQRPSDDPAAASRALDIGETLRRIEQYGTNARLADQRLALEDSALNGVQGLLARVKDLALAANSGAQTPETRLAYAAEVSERLEELVDFANVRDANGDYLFSGFKTGTVPFYMSAGTAVYQGDQGGRELQISATRRVSAGDSGDAVFMRVPTGNGDFRVSADAANAGSGVMSPGSVVDVTAFTGDSYSVRFTSATTFDIVNDTQGTTVASAQPFTEGASIVFDGISVDIEGQPATGDRFDVAPAGTQPMFETLQQFIDLMQTPTPGVADQARLNQSMNDVIDGLDRAIDHLLGVRATVGARQNAVESVDAQNADLEFELQATRSEVEDLDMTQAIASLQQRITSLEAVQASFAAVSRLSLFDFLR